MANIGLHLDTCLGSYDLPLDSRTEESELVQGLRTAQENAYEALIVRYQQPVYNLVYRLLNDSSDSSDVVQEVFLKVFRNIGSFRGQSSLKTWIYRIAVNEAHNHRRWFCRHRKQEIGLEREDDERSYQDTLSDPGRSPYQIAADDEAHRILEEAMQQLNPTFRAAIVLRDLEDMSYEEIADVLQIHLGTVKSRIMRGREALRRALSARLAPAARENGAIHWSAQTAE